jgi:competence protein ComFB
MAKSRSEIDKEMMYRKIMPSAGKKSGSAVSGPDESAVTVDMGAAGLMGSTAAVPTAAIRRPAVSLPVKEEQNMVLINLMEELVLSKLDATLDRFNCCKCDKCKKDIAALALNRLKPHYVVMSEQDEDHRKKNEEMYASEVTSALIQAILMVKKEPRH